MEQERLNPGSQEKLSSPLESICLWDQALYIILKLLGLYTWTFMFLFYFCIIVFICFFFPFPCVAINSCSIQARTGSNLRTLPIQVLDASGKLSTENLKMHCVESIKCISREDFIVF